MLYSRDDLFLLHAYPLDTFADPTGAGDSFAGIDGCSAASEKTMQKLFAKRWHMEAEAFGVEEFSLD